MKLKYSIKFQIKCLSKIVFVMTFMGFQILFDYGKKMKVQMVITLY